MAGATQVALPIDEFLPGIVERLRRAPNLVLVAEPGAGKTTRLPRALLEAGFARDGQVLVLEPRRLAARLSAERVAEELGEAVGGRVGYAVRFERKVSAQTRLVFLTEGLLSRRLAEDPTLRGVAAVVFDEFHERNVHSDLGLAMLRRLQAKRPELRLVVMSATIDAARVAAFLDAEVVDVPGRTFPVTVTHETAPDDRPLERRVASAVRALAGPEAEGDLLVFLPGAGEIRRAEAALEGFAAERGFGLALLHGELPKEEQDRAVRPDTRRRVILSTNVAETSLTLPSVTCVVDSGLARVLRHSPFSGLPALEVEKVSQASLTQRAGRAGRVRAGRAHRLFTEHDATTRPRFDEPEIRRIDLAELALVLAAAGEDVRSFPFFEAPSAASAKAAFELLVRLGAFDAEGRLTRLGGRMLTLPIHPRLARLAIAAADDGVGARGVALAAVLSERDVVRTSRGSLGARAEATDVVASDALHRVEAVERAEAERLSRGVLEALSLDRQAVQGVLRVRDRLARALDVPALPSAPAYEEEDALLLATLRAFPDRVGKKRTARGDDVVFAGGGSAKLAPQCAVRDAEWLVALDAQKGPGGVSVRLASRIEPEWLLDLPDDRLVEQRTLRLDPSTQQVEVRTSLRYDGLVLEERVVRDGHGDDVRDCLVRAVLDHGLEKFWDRDDVERLRHRLAFAHAHGLPVPAPDDTLVERALTALCEGRRSFADLRGTSLVASMLDTLPRDARSRLDAFAPNHVAIAGRPAVPVQYVAAGAPHIESRLQDFFGTLDGPRIAEGRVPVVLHLLAPNHRAVQVTTDLAGFWDRHYPAVRKELMRQYPRHAWPEDPRTATPSRPGRPRG